MENRLFPSTLRGHTYPLGAAPDVHGVNFCVFSQHAGAVELLLFDSAEAPTPARILDMQPTSKFCNHYWYLYVPNLRLGTHYAYRVHAPENPPPGDHFAPEKVLIDPYAHAVYSKRWSRRAACVPGVDNASTSMHGIVVDIAHYDWEDVQKPLHPLSNTVIYEMHVRGFTQSPTSGVAKGLRGTFMGVIAKIPYLKGLGVTAVELLPICNFDKTDCDKVNPTTGERLTDYWGYNTVSFFSPEDRYCITPEAGTHLDEFRNMVKALHRAGIEVIMDVVFNHTSEGGDSGPYISFRGFDQCVYYMLTMQNTLRDLTGCGNTVNCNNLIVQRFIRRALEFWARDMHVDGFRFDEGSILMRDENGNRLPYPPLINDIALSEDLAEAKIIAEAWDAGGLYEVGGFPDRWLVWNGRFRDTIRGFIKGDTQCSAGGLMVQDVATRIAGSSDLFAVRGLPPTNSVNFITCHDGFTLNDLFSYNQKHNTINGEGNSDGISDQGNLSWNCGVEGDTDDSGIIQLRKQLMKNSTAILLLSRGVPMILGGDEMARTQQGDNNTYNQDNDINWYDWELAEKNADLVRFVTQMIAFHRQHASLSREVFYAPGDIAWHGTQLNAPGWYDPEARVLSFTIAPQADDTGIHVILNMYWEELAFALPAPPAGCTWVRVIDTAEPSPQDIVDMNDPAAGSPITGKSYTAQARSVVVLVASRLNLASHD